VQSPPADGCELLFTRAPARKPDQQLLPSNAGGTLPAPPQPGISAKDAIAAWYRPARSGH